MYLLLKMLKIRTIKKSLWARKFIEENHVERDEVLKESKKTRTQSCYVALATELIKSKPSNTEEAL